MEPSLPKVLKEINSTIKETIVEEKDEKEQAVIKEFECPICLSYAAPPIMMCQSSHVVCHTCWKKCYNCPTCRDTGCLNCATKYDSVKVAPKSLTRALVLENIYPLLTFPCRYEGCSFQGNGAFTPIHEQSCTFYPIACPLNKAFDCSWRGPIGYTKKHLIQNHRANVYFEPNVRLVSSGLGYCNKKNYAVIFCCYGRIFRFSLEYDRSILSDVEFNMVQIGCRNNSESFRYVLKFFNKFPIQHGNHGFLATQPMVSKEPNELQSIEYNQSQITNAKWRIHFNHLLSYCTDNGDFYYEVILEKNYSNFRKGPFKKYHKYR